MEVKCPRCGFKGELVDNKCQICELDLDPNSIRTLSDRIYRSIIPVSLVIICLFAYLFWGGNTSPKAQKTQIKEPIKIAKQMSATEVKSSQFDSQQNEFKDNQGRVSQVTNEIKESENPAEIVRTVTPVMSFYVSISDDYNKLPKIQLEKKYVGIRLLSTFKEKIMSLEYIPQKNVSRMIVIPHSEEVWTKAYKDDEYKWLDAVERRGFLFTRYLVILEFPGSELSLKYKNGDLFPINGIIRGIEKRNWRHSDSKTGFKSEYTDYQIYCEPI